MFKGRINLEQQYLGKYRCRHSVLTLSYILKPNITLKKQRTKHTQLSVHIDGFNVRYTQIKLS
ncbi:hypothetical protein VCR31J2_2260025 [Vibrio coralliirubri]|uniref:Uncharacterized protein n=1 Tax=Vibrio coralliirubri TaxID=1516159 RepID=A0AA86XV69_9VIBR|nr:hypothetical protein VCR31J2_2260025 [Vibrio coralliirubri]